MTPPIPYYCLRCGHRWFPRPSRAATIPICCGRCKSPYWRTEPQPKNKKTRRKP